MYKYIYIYICLHIHIMYIHIYIYIIFCFALTKALHCDFLVAACNISRGVLKRYLVSIAIVKI